MDKPEPITSQVGLMILNSSIIVIVPVILVLELLRFLSVIKKRVYSTTKGFVIIFSITAIVYSSAELIIQALTMVGTLRKYEFENHRVFYGVQKLLEALCEVCLVVFTSLLFYSSVWKAMHLDVKVFTSMNTTSTITNFAGLKGLTVLLCMLIAPVVASTTFAEGFVLMFAKIKAVPEATLGLRIASDVILYVPLLFILPIVCVVSYNVLKTAENEGINNYGNEEFDEVKARAKHASFIYFLLSGLFLTRLILGLLHELMYLFNHGGTIKKKNGVIVTDWLDSFVHWAFIVFFVITYFLRFSEIEAPVSPLSAQEYDDRSGYQQSE